MRASGLSSTLANALLLSTYFHHEEHGCKNPLQEGGFSFLEKILARRQPDYSTLLFSIFCRSAVSFRIKRSCAYYGPELGTCGIFSFFQ